MQPPPPGPPPPPPPPSQPPPQATLPSTAGKDTSRLKVPVYLLAAAFGIWNLVGGIFYDRLRFGPLGQDPGSGVIPGLWILLPPLAIIVTAIGTPLLGAIFVYALKTKGYDHRGGLPWAMAFVVESLLVHLFVISAMVI